jgi:endonuclease G
LKLNMPARRRWNSDGPDYDQIVNISARALRRLDPRSQVLVAVLLISAAGVAAAVMCHRARPDRSTANAPPPPPPSASAQSAVAIRSPNLLLGNPSGATSDPANRNNYLMVKPFYALSYNDASGTPNWVSWRVTRADLGSAPRKQVFDPDATLPPGFKVITHGDYTGSGFDRGHLCPRSDRSATEEMSFATFVMTNIIPQAPNVNGKAWNNLENYCRDMVRRGTTGKRLYVVAGPAGRGGQGSRGPRETIGGGSRMVVVPAECWKVIVAVPDEGADDPSRITADARVIAVVMPNDNDAVGDEWAKYRVTPAEIEQRTGLKFFDRLASDVAEALRRKLDDVTIPPPRPAARGR